MKVLTGHPPSLVVIHLPDQTKLITTDYGERNGLNCISALISELAILCNVQIAVIYDG